MDYSNGINRFKIEKRSERKAELLEKQLIELRNILKNDQ